ncbi:methyltransferase domain-containing protein [Acidisoma cladoniae]|jgi:NADH dehydrogenase [ubiquinone] 1 alpha subcomplex assembly factor 5|uniref:methyltransferase domain-containing protein n=1 Tax=Acidisoma cladoniae TaxID=3040935 RepID=UPI00254BB602|nr:methyltransferase domain-containing protein [Acidisoma sp. PAMC 29798]
MAWRLVRRHPADFRGSRSLTDGSQIFDRAAVRRHRDRAVTTVSAVAPILDDVADRLLDRLADTTRRFTHALDLGGRGIIAPRLRALGIATVAMDLSEKMAALSGAPYLVADEELLPFGENSFDLVVANLSLHWVNDLPGALIQLRRALRPEGLLLASMPLLGTLDEARRALTETETELRGGISPRISPFPELRDCAGLLQRAGFTLPVADFEDIDLLYANPLGLLRDLQAAGERNAIRERSRAVPPRALFPMALMKLPVTPEGRFRTTLRLGIMTGWAP